jgi:CBS domain containing-hemolysin-like protein
VAEAADRSHRADGAIDVVGAGNALHTGEAGIGPQRAAMAAALAIAAFDCPAVDNWRRCAHPLRSPFWNVDFKSVLNLAGLKDCAVYASHARCFASPVCNEKEQSTDSNGTDE